MIPEGVREWGILRQIIKYTCKGRGVFTSGKLARTIWARSSPFVACCSRAFTRSASAFSAKIFARTDGQHNPQINIFEVIMVCAECTNTATWNLLCIQLELPLVSRNRVFNCSFHKDEALPTAKFVFD